MRAESRLPPHRAEDRHPTPPWTPTDGISIRLDVGLLPVRAVAAERKSAADLHLGALPQCATWVWTDGSATGG